MKKTFFAVYAMATILLMKPDMTVRTLMTNPIGALSTINLSFTDGKALTALDDTRSGLGLSR